MRINFEIVKKLKLYIEYFNIRIPDPQNGVTRIATRPV